MYRNGCRTAATRITGERRRTDSAWEERDDGDCGLRGIRGGMWLWAQNNVRSSVRMWNRPTFNGRALGFRLVRDIQ